MLTRLVSLVVCAALGMGSFGCAMNNAGLADKLGVAREGAGNPEVYQRKLAELIELTAQLPARSQPVALAQEGSNPEMVLDQYNQLVPDVIKEVDRFSRFAAELIFTRGVSDKVAGQIATALAKFDSEKNDAAGETKAPARGAQNADAIDSALALIESVGPLLGDLVKAEDDPQAKQALAKLVQEAGYYRLVLRTLSGDGRALARYFEDDFKTSGQKAREGFLEGLKTAGEVGGGFLGY